MDELTLSRLTGITSIDLGFEEIAMRLLLAFTLSLLTATVYRATHKSYSFSYNLVVSIILVSIIVCMVLMVIDNSLARAFGLVGALAIIRFRTPVKDIRDIIFLFAAVATGIATGAGAYSIAIAGILFTNLVAFLLYQKRFGSQVRGDTLLLKVFCKENMEDEEPFIDLLKKHCDSYSLVEMLKGSDFPQEYIFSIQLSSDEQLQPLSNELLADPGIKQISVLSAVHHMDMQ
jgi:uncharacterized membrane protein YhiD involved in acid resistance